VLKVRWSAKVLKSGTGYSVYVYLPVELARALPDRLYIWREGLQIVISPSPAPGAAEVRKRAIAHAGGRQYYGVLIPKPVAEELGLEGGERVEIELEGDRVLVRKLE